ncbi:hypothetical protein EDC01DRAFT_725484 [Geopyxis carbonaria]|nr:hypothetical protein EDC01DRAFT_725484 [Geopyxis carbonaria]
MDFYTSPEGGSKAYIVNNYLEWFKIPLEVPNDKTQATVIVVSSAHGTLWVVAYSVLVVILFMAISKLVTGMVITWFPLKDSGNRHAMLVAYYTSNSPSSALFHMYLYIQRALFKSTLDGKRAINWNTLQGALMLSSVSLALLAATLAANFMVGGKRLIVRRASLANSKGMVLPEAANNADNGPGGVYEGWVALRNAAVTAAIGRVQSSQNRLPGRVITKMTETASDNGNRTMTFTYHYHVNSSDWGLQNAYGLSYEVSGKCTTEYGRIAMVGVRDPKNKRLRDVYSGFNWGSDYDTYSYYDEGLYAAPRVNVFPHPRPRHNVHTFQMVPHTVHRYSFTENKEDPWYLTEPSETYLDNPSQTVYRVKPSRPPLHCAQYDVWNHGGHSVANVTELSTLANRSGLVLGTFIRDRVFPREFSTAPMVYIANFLGVSGLQSGAEYIPNTHSFNAANASMEQDLIRLAQAAFVYSREVVRNTVLLNPTPRFNPTNLTNVATDSDQADFIIESRDVAALRVSVLLSVPALCIFFWAIVYVRGKIYKVGMRTSNKGFMSRHNLFTVGLVPMQMYRLLDEEVTRLRRWSGRKSITPYIKDIKMDKPERVDLANNTSTMNTSQGADPDRGTGANTAMSGRSYTTANSNEKAFARMSVPATGNLSPAPEYQADTKANADTIIPPELSSTPTTIEPVPISVGCEDTNPRITQTEKLASSPFIIPKLIPISVNNGVIQPAISTKRSLFYKVICFWRKPRRPEKYELVMTNVWRPILGGSDKGGNDDIWWEEIRHNVNSEEGRQDETCAVM